MTKFKEVSPMGVECNYCGVLLPKADIKDHQCNPAAIFEYAGQKYAMEHKKEGVVERPEKTEVLTRDVAPTLVGTLEDTERRYKEMQEFIKKQMIKDEDYGEIPGCPKPSLFKPGAEKLLEIYGYAVSDIQVVNKVEDWEKGFFHYEMKAIATSKRSGQVIGTGIGSCNTKEKKFIKQDPFSMVNTIEKMAKKRAIVDLALLVTRSSGIFTQDVEDMDINGTDKPKPASIKPQEPLPAIKGTLTIAEALTRNKDEVFDVQGMLSDFKTETIISKKDKKPHNITRYKILSEDSQYGMTISKWGQVQENIRLGDMVLFVLVKVDEFNGEKKYLAQAGIELVKATEELPPEE